MYVIKGNYMWKQLVSALTRIGLLTLVPMVMAVGSAQGQSLSYKIQATIPFDFIAGDKQTSSGRVFHRPRSTRFRRQRPHDQQQE